jgi:hypothetical protein
MLLLLLPPLQLVLQLVQRLLRLRSWLLVVLARRYDRLLPVDIRLIAMGVQQLLLLPRKHNLRVLLRVGREMDAKEVLMNVDHEAFGGRLLSLLHLHLLLVLLLMLLLLLLHLHLSLMQLLSAQLLMLQLQLQLVVVLAVLLVLEVLLQVWHVLHVLQLLQLRTRHRHRPADATTNASHNASSATQDTTTAGNSDNPPASDCRSECVFRVTHAASERSPP